MNRYKLQKHRNTKEINKRDDTPQPHHREQHGRAVTKRKSLQSDQCPGPGARPQRPRRSFKRYADLRRCLCLSENAQMCRFLAVQHHKRIQLSPPWPRTPCGLPWSRWSGHSSPAFECALAARAGSGAPCCSAGCSRTERTGGAYVSENPPEKRRNRQMRRTAYSRNPHACGTPSVSHSWVCYSVKQARAETDSPEGWSTVSSLKEDAVEHIGERDSQWIHFLSLAKINVQELGVD